MKKALLILAITLSSIVTYGQACIPDGSITIPGIYPDTIENLPHAYAGAAFNTTVQINTLTDTLVPQGNVVVDYISLDNVMGMPAGFSYACNPGNCQFPAGQTKCLAVNGTPPYSPPGTYPLIINITLHGRLFGIIPVTQPAQRLGYKIVILGPPAANFSGTPTSICKNGSVSYTDLSSNEPTSWSWSFPGGTPSSSSLQVPPSITYSSTGTKNVTLMVTSPAGSNSLTKTAYITVNALPAATVTPTGTVVFCSGSNVLLSGNTGTGLGYQWIKNAVDIGGATSSTYLATTGGNYKVRVTNSNGCTKVSAITTLSVSSVTATATAQGATTFCSGGSVTISANSGTGLTYQWVKGVTDIAGATGLTYNVTASGTYKVRVTNADGCSKTSSGVAVTVNPLPSAAVTANGPLSFCAGGSVTFTAASGTGYTYQWKKNGVIIGGATNKMYTATTAGTYKVVVSNSATGCTKTSAGQVVSVPCKVQGDLISGDNAVTIFPNPANESVVISSEAGDIREIIIFDALGRQVFSKALTTPNSNLQTQIDVSGFDKGIYFVQVTAADKTKSLKLVVE
ncbi:MAG: T9SS type A sorting domain-containing protein [Bacteroidia bacterium]